MDATRREWSAYERADEARAEAAERKRRAKAEADVAHRDRVATWKTVTLTVQCPHENCSGDITTSMQNETSCTWNSREYREGTATVACGTCNHSVCVSASGKTVALGPKGLKLGDEEDISIKQNRVCTKCRHYKPKHINPPTWWVLLITTSVFLAIYLVLIGYVKTNWGDVTLFGFHVLTIAKYGLGGIGVVALLYLLYLIDDNTDLNLFERVGPHCLSVNVLGKEIKTYGSVDLNRNLRCKFWE